MLVRGGVHQCPAIPLTGGYTRFQVIEMWSKHDEIGTYRFREFERKGREETFDVVDTAVRFHGIIWREVTLKSFFIASPPLA